LGPPSYMRSAIDWNVVLQCATEYCSYVNTIWHFTLCNMFIRMLMICWTPDICTSWVPSHSEAPGNITEYPHMHITAEAILNLLHLMHHASSSWPSFLFPTLQQFMVLNQEAKITFLKLFHCLFFHQLPYISIAKYMKRDKDIGMIAI